MVLLVKENSVQKFAFSYFSERLVYVMAHWYAQAFHLIIEYHPEQVVRFGEICAEKIIIQSNVDGFPTQRWM